mgnify:CR=1 FL=1
MKPKKKYTLHITCTQAQWNKIQNSVRSILPKVSKQRKFHDQYGFAIQAGLDDGMKPADIHRVLVKHVQGINRQHNTKRRLPRYSQVYLSCKELTQNI